MGQFIKTFPLENNPLAIWYGTKLPKNSYRAVNCNQLTEESFLKFQ